MNDKDFTKFAFIAGALAILWWVAHKREANAQVPEGGNDNAVSTPTDYMTQVYAANPSQFGPMPLGTINVNIGNQGLGYLSNAFIPLFGFVGMAQGVMYQ